MEEKKTNGYQFNIKKTLSMIGLVFIIGLVINIIFSLFVKNNILLTAIQKVSWYHLLIPFLCYGGLYLVDTIRLMLVLSQFKYKVSFKDMFVNSVLGYFFSYLTPMATGGQPFQIYHLKTCGVDSKTATNISLSRLVEFAFTSLAIVLIGVKWLIDIAQTASIGAPIIYLGFSISLALGIGMLLLLIKPDTVGKIALKLEKKKIGALVKKITKKQDWSALVHNWSQEFKENIRFLWSEKLPVMILDILLGLGNLILQVLSLYALFIFFLGINVNFFQILLTFLLLNLVVYYIPTPGASGTIEGVYSMVFLGLTGKPDLTFVSIIVWRFSTYYMHIFFGLFFFLYFYFKEKAQNKKTGVNPDQKNEDNPPLPGLKKKAKSYA